MPNINDQQYALIDLNIGNGVFKTSTFIDAELDVSNRELEIIDETIASVDFLRPHCDKIDYALAAGSGMLCSLIDTFLVGAPNGESVLGNATDEWVESCVKRIAKFKGWDPKDSKSSAISYLENLFKVPYDQTGCGDAGKEIFGLTPKSHHFKSLGHNFSIVGLMFSIIDQFTNQSHFVSDGQLIALEEADAKFVLRGNTFLGKLWCGFVNWIGHIISDVAGSSSSVNRGMGIPSPIWFWINSIITLKAKLGFSNTEFDKRLNEIAIKVFENGVDFRFTMAQAIPVVLNELIVRLFYSIRRFVNICKSGEYECYSWSEIWQICKPFEKPTLTRMLTVAHGTFCALDLSDATIRAFIKGGGAFNPITFFVRLNVVGVGRFTISLYSEAKMGLRIRDAEHRAMFAKKERKIIEDYIHGLEELSRYYNDDNFRDLVKSIANSKNVKIVFQESSIMASNRGVSNSLKDKSDIDNYFINK